jgi:hypothetical protein
MQKPDAIIASGFFVWSNGAFERGECRAVIASEAK